MRRLVAFALLLVMTSRTRRRRSRGGTRTVGFDEDRTNAHILRAELSVLADDVIRLEPRVALHARQLSFTHPTRPGVIEVVAAVPADWPAPGRGRR